MKNIKEFLNKHLFVFILILLVIVTIINYFIFPKIINNKLSFVDIPVSSKTLSSNTLIDKNDIIYIQVQKELLPNNIITNVDDIIGKYVIGDSLIVKNSFFYSELIDDNPSKNVSPTKTLNNGEYAFSLKIDNEYINNNLLACGQYIDVIYTQQYLDEKHNSAYLVGELLHSKRIIDIYDLNNVDKIITLAVNESDFVNLVLTSKLAKKYDGSFVPTLGFNSKEYTDSSFYFDQQSFANYIREKGELFIK